MQNTQPSQPITWLMLTKLHVNTAKKTQKPKQPCKKTNKCAN